MPRFTFLKMGRDASDAGGKKERLDQILLRLGYVTEEEVKQALLRQKTHGGRLGSQLLQLNLVTEDELVRALAEQHGVPGFRREEHPISRPALERLGFETAEDLQVVPIDYDGGRARVAAADPGDAAMITRVKRAFGARDVEVYVAPESLIRTLIERHYPGGAKRSRALRIVEVRDPLDEGDGARGPTLRASEKRAGVPGPGTMGDPPLDDPVPYRRLIRSFTRSLQIIAEVRCREAGWMPPYVLICNDIQRLARRFGFGRLAEDGLQTAAYLLVPSEPTTHAENTPTEEPPRPRFVDFDTSLEFAKSLHFPWNVRDVLQTLQELLSGARTVAGAEEAEDDTMLAAQILALVWYHRTVSGGSRGSRESVAGAAARRLREQAGRLARPEIIDGYIALLERANEELRLLDAGFDDVFVPPYEFDAVASRISKSLRGVSGKEGRREKPVGFGADFTAFSFIDLLQALGQSSKTVHIRLVKSTGESAEVYMRRGRLVHALCGRLAGEAAVYRVIGWGDDGTFRVEPTDRFPPHNITEPNEAILMEGCRLLDESAI